MTLTEETKAANRLMTLTEETKAANRRQDPDCTKHCGCGVPFTMDCPDCKDFLGDEYCSPDEEPNQ